MYADEVYCYQPISVVIWSVGLSLSPAETAEPIEMPFAGLRTRVCPGNHVLDGGQIPRGKGQF